MYECALCNRGLSEILPTVIEEHTETVPVLFLAGNMLPICTRCSTENVISLTLYGNPIVEYNTRIRDFTPTQAEFGDIKCRQTNKDRQFNLDIYNKVKSRYQKPERMYLSIR